MIIGNGFIATSIKNIDDEKILFYCAGVSNSHETSKKEFDKEVTLLKSSLKNNLGVKVVYFSSIANYLTNKSYYKHKKNIEKIIINSNRQYIIIRLAQVIGRDAPVNSFFPNMVNHIKKSIPIAVYDSYRSLLDIDDLCKIVNHLILSEYDGIIDIKYVELLRVMDILSLISQNLNIPFIVREKVKFNFNIEKNNNIVNNILNILNIGGNGYTEKIIKKYIGESKY